MRVPIPDDDVLEPLPVFEGDARFDPVFARDRPEAPPRPSAREVVAAVGALLAERREVRARAPWSAPAPASVAAPRATRFTATFSRMVALDPALLGGLPAWHRGRARDGRVRVSRRLALDVPQRVGVGAWRVRGRLRSRWRMRSIPVELLLWPHLGAWTKLTLEPRRRVHVGRRYFKGGHRVLDRLTAQLDAELPRPARA